MPKPKNENYKLGSLKEYYLRITKKPKLFLDVYKIQVSESGSVHTYQVSPETHVVLQILYSRFDFEAVFGEWIDVYMLIVSESDDSESSSESIVRVNVDLENEKRRLFQLLSTKTEIDEDNEIDLGNNLGLVKSCDRPSVILGEDEAFTRRNRTIISGLSSTLRFLFKLVSIKNSKLGKEFEDLLGFRGGCLQACAESSTWTKFCEFDVMRKMMRSLTDIYSLHEGGQRIVIPEDLVRFEYHLIKPVRVHNYSKWLHEKVPRERGSPDPEVKTKILGRVNYKEAVGQIPHDFAEGVEMRLSDLILFPCIDLALSVLGESVFDFHLPNVLAWMKRLRLPSTSEMSTKSDLSSPRLVPHYENYNDVGLVLTLDGNRFAKPFTEAGEPKLHISPLEVELPEVAKESLYSSDTSRYNPKLRIFTKQEDIDETLQKLSNAGIELIQPNDNSKSLNDVEELLDWSKIPKCAQPGTDGGQLPEKRLEKKYQQLANLLQMVKFVYAKYTEENPPSENLRIVDFCSGGGHLGILIAYLFPNCEVFLVENKEESLRRAKDRVETLELENVSFIQCNLTSFLGQFDIGVGLHACGSATDLILSKCVKVRASFVVCPCCYGGIRSSGDAGLSYPRSESFRRASGLTLENYLVLAHSADQTHEEGHAKTGQGKVSMRAVDTDRLKAFDEACYQTWLRIIVPATASPKNHILVGLAL